MEDLTITNDKRKFKLVLEMLKQIERVSFETEVGQELHTDLVTCISEVIRPILIKKGHQLITIENQIKTKHESNI